MTSQSGAEVWKYWHSELEMSRLQRGKASWVKRGETIIRRYKDERNQTPDYQDSDRADGSKFNILWSNIQTLLPALIAKQPKPVVERRYLDRDEVGRTASTILERALLYELDQGSYQSALRKAVLDRLLPGRGVVWVRYEARFTPMPQKTQEDTEDDENADVGYGNDQPAGGDSDRDGSDGSSDQDGYDSRDGGVAERVDEQVAYECTPVDYIDWRDFDHSPARTWEEVWWISKRVYMTRDEISDRFGADKAKKIPLDSTPMEGGKEGAIEISDKQKKAKIIEIWNKRERKVCWIAEKWSEDVLDELDDPLRLEGFFPVPKPLFSTLSNDSLIPVPDYAEYQDQAAELDDLTARISALVKVIKVAGVYDSSADELQRMFEEGFENKLVPTANWAQFAQSIGANGMAGIWLLPIKDLAATLASLYQSREAVKQVLYEITGLSDIIRGQATGPASTATEQRIKGQFASMRLNDMQGEVARFARDTLRIMGEIISEHYDPMTLYQVSGYEQYARDQFQSAGPQSPMMGHDGGPPMSPAMPGGPPSAPGMGGPVPVQPPSAPGAGPQFIDPQLAAQQKAAQVFKQAVELLRNDKLRGFRIDIETDSLIEPDQQAMQQARSELLGAISQFLPQSIQAGAAMPELRPLLARLLMFFLRGFKASRDIESAFEQFIDDMSKEAQNPKPKLPSPEEVKASADKDMAQMQLQSAQQKQQGDLAMIQAQMQAKQQELEIERQRMELERQKMAMEMEMMQAKHQIEMQKLAVGAQVDQRATALDLAATERQAAMDAETQERQHEMGIEAMAAKAQAAKSNGAAQ